MSVVLAFDGDESGQVASLRAIERSYEEQFEDGERPNHNQNWVKYNEEYRNFLSLVVSTWGSFVGNPQSDDEWRQIRRWSTYRIHWALEQYDDMIEAALFYGQAYLLEWFLPIAREYRNRLEVELERRATGKNRTVPKTERMKEWLDANEVIKAINPLDIYLHYLPDLEVGKKWSSAKCPKHKAGEERTASFRMNMERGNFYCFGCGWKGGLFDFVMQMDKISLPEATKKVADIGRYVKR